jgi:glutaconate CoA-transferase subunit B
LHPEVTLEDVLANTGFPLQVPDKPQATPLPTPEELRLLREEIDPKGVYLG